MSSSDPGHTEAQAKLLASLSSLAAHHELSKHFKDLGIVFRGIETIDSPIEYGWLRLEQLLREAGKDLDIKASAPAVNFLKFVLALVEANVPEVGDRGTEPFDQIVSASYSANAKQRHAGQADAKAWVLEEWRKGKDAYKGNKSDFARAYSRRCLQEKKTTVTERTIRESWLKGV